MKKEIIISSDENYENLVAEIYVADKYICLVSYDTQGAFFVETPTPNRSNEAVISHQIDYDTFVELLHQAKKALQ